MIITYEEEADEGKGGGWIMTTGIHLQTSAIVLLQVAYQVLQGALSKRVIIMTNL